jgi:hypothetical protein
MSISSTGLYGSATIVNSDLCHASSSSYTARATIVNSDLFNGVETLKEQVTTLSTSYLDTTREHREDISQNRQDISQNVGKINYLSNNRIVAIEQQIYLIIV